MDFTGKFTYPFRYTPHPLIEKAARELIARIGSDPSLDSVFSPGKMLGVLAASNEDGKVEYLFAFSGLAGGQSIITGFVPPVYDTSSVELLKDSEGATPERSRELQDWLFSQYKVKNGLGDELSVKEIFALRGITPPGGTGDCAAPKLLNYAFRHGLKPLAMGEFWYGDSPAREVREQGRFYPSCTGKCGPLLTWMLQGIDVEPNPLDEGYSCNESHSVIYADDTVLVVRKPAGMLSVPGRTSAESLLEILQKSYGEVYSCHRLDMDTSGLMVFARRPEARTELERQFSEGTVQKTYRARLCAGDKPFGHRPEGTIALPLAPDWYDRPRQCVDRENGKAAITEYRVIEHLPNGETEIELRPRTGRTHQLRVHCAHVLGLGHPIKGDMLYGAPSEERMYLDACRIRFRHPDTGKDMEFV